MTELSAAEGPFARVYQWETPSWGAPARGKRAIVRLRNLAGWPSEWRGLTGKFASVRNAAIVNEPGPSDTAVPTAIGDACPDESSQLFFEPGRGGGRIDKVSMAAADFRRRYVQAARFGEVNTYHHLDRIASYLNDLLREIGAKPIPPVVAIVNAHHAAVDRGGERDGRRCPDGRWVPFQGGHYRLPGLPTKRIPEHAPLSPDGEIHLGPGQKLTAHGALARLVGGPYRANASHNPAIIYHEYGHHLCRHTADFRANRLRPPGRQSNRKNALDEGTSDYFTAAMLGTPHIWFFHHRDDDLVPHRRSLTWARTMDSYVRGAGADPHANGSIWASALWELRRLITARTSRPNSAQDADRLVVLALLLIGDDAPDSTAGGSSGLPALTERRRSFRRAAAALLHADEVLYHRALCDDIVYALGSRGILLPGTNRLSRSAS